LNLFKRYIFWTYERGSFHYDVMVTLILLFIFLSPRFIPFGDRPVEAHVHGHDIVIQASAGGVFVYQVSTQQLHDPAMDGLSLQQKLIAGIQPIAGPLVLDRYEEQRDANGNVEAYKVFAHRPADTRVQ